MAKKKKKTQKFAAGKFFNMGHEIKEELFLAEFTKRAKTSPHDTDVRRVRGLFRLLGEQYLREFDATVSMEFNDFVNHWYGIGKEMSVRYNKALQKRFAYEYPGIKLDLDVIAAIQLYGRRMIESLWVLHHQKRILANESFVNDLDISDWDFSDLDALNDSVVEFVNEDGTYINVYTDVTKTEGYFKDTEGKMYDIFTLTVTDTEGKRVELCVSPSLPNKFMVKNLGRNVHTFTTDLDTTVTTSIIEPSDELLHETILRHLYALIECSHQYATTVTRVHKRRNTKYEPSTNQPMESTKAPRSLIKYVYVDAEPYTLDELRTVVKRGSPRCHERSGAWCVSKKGKVFWRKPTVVNKGKGNITYKMNAPTRKEESDVSET